MPIGALVAVPELQAEGPARLEGSTPGFHQIRFLASGAAMTQESKRVVRYALLPGTRIRCGTPPRPATVLGEAPAKGAEGRLVYQIADADGARATCDEADIVLVEPARDPAEQLRTVAFHELRPRFAKAGTPMPPEAWGPRTYSAREELCAWRDRAWHETGGVIALAGARIEALPHQILAARRMLADRQVRFLLADEVGLGKTIEAGLVIQSLLAMDPRLRVLVVAPGSLLSQWFCELYIKFGGRRFTLADSDRLEVWEDGDPFAQQFLLCSGQAIEQLSAARALQFEQADWDILVVDECHRMQPDGLLYRRLAELSARTEHVLLLSATPGPQHAAAHLALLHLLQPDAWSLADADRVREQWQDLQRLGSLLERSAAAPVAEWPALVAEWTAFAPADARLAAALAAVDAADATHRPAALAALRAYVREHHQLDHRVIRHRRRVLAELSAAAQIPALPLASRSGELRRYAVDSGEAAVRAALQAYIAGLVRIAEGVAEPRLVHWCLQLVLALGAHPDVLGRLLAMRAAVLADPDEFDEYRQRAGQPRIRDLLRADASDTELMTQIAISAASTVAPGVEDRLLHDLRAAQEHWAGRDPARVSALLAGLDGFWEEFPDEKVLVFTGTTAAVPALVRLLRARLGAEAVVGFGGHLDLEEREDAARRFREDDACTVLISDPLGGEGRNFQFVSLVVHLDLPWNLGAVEQRIGRVDRLGRDGVVPSWVLLPDDDTAIDAVWARLLAEAIGVFDRSSSGLEMMAPDLEEDFAAIAIVSGGAAALAALPRWQERIAAERAGDDEQVDALFHAEAASFAEAAGLAAATDADRGPVGAVCRWLQGMGGRVRRDEERPGVMHLQDRSGTESTAGVFDRRRALNHESLAFFAPGQALVDHCIADAAAAGWCAANAWRRRSAPAVAKWEGLRVSCELQLDYGPLVAAGLSLSCLRRLFSLAVPERPVLLVRCDGTPETRPGAVAHLLPGYDEERGDRCLSARTSRETWMQPFVSGKHAQVVGWQERVGAAATAAGRLIEELGAAERDRLLAACREQLEAQAAVLAVRAEHASARLGAEHPDSQRLVAEADAEAIQVAALLGCLEGARFAPLMMAYILVS